MKRFVVCTVLVLAAFAAGAKEKSDWKGKVVDQNGDPVAYANVAVLSRADSTMICGVVTEEDVMFFTFSYTSSGRFDTVISF